MYDVYVTSYAVDEAFLFDVSIYNLEKEANVSSDGTSVNCQSVIAVALSWGARSSVRIVALPWVCYLSFFYLKCNA